jgi:predicted ATPase
VGEFKRHFGDVEVDLDQAQGWPFVHAFLDTEPNRLGAAFRETLYRQTGGHPLFTIELLRNMQERGDLLQDEEGRWVEGPALAWDALPARVEGVIEKRVGRLDAELQEALTVASVEGEAFTAQVIARVQGVSEGHLVHRLAQELDRQHRLVRERGIKRVGERRLSLYRFRHNLFQTYLYSSLGQTEREFLHEEVGNALEALYGECAEENAAIAPQLARHFQEAGLAEKAICFFLQAGKRAVRMSANEEALAHFTQGLDLLEALPNSPERAQQELALQMALVAPLQALKGFGGPEVGRTYARARELCQQIGETPQLFPVLFLLADFYGTQGKHHAAHELAGQCLTLAERADDAAFIAMAHWLLGRNLYLCGEFVQARVHLEHTLALYKPQQHHSLVFLYGYDYGVGSLIFESLALWSLGYSEQALERSQEVLTLAQELSHPFIIALAQGMTSVLCVCMRDRPMAQELAEACIDLSTEQGFPYWLASGIFCRGWALAEGGQVEEGAAQMRQSIAADQARETEVGHTCRLAFLAETYGKMGQVKQGLALLAEALAMVHRNGERLFEAEIHRLKGELLQMQGESEAEVEACFRQAIAVTRQQSARSLELRATMSLCRLWQKQGKVNEARQMLGEIYGWFTEGFDTPDLQEARTLLEALLR